MTQVEITREQKQLGYVSATDGALTPVTVGQQKVYQGLEDITLELRDKRTVRPPRIEPLPKFFKDGLKRLSKQIKEKSRHKPVVVHEPKAYAVAQTLKEKGYEVSDNEYRLSQEVPQTGFYVLKKGTERSLRTFFIKENTISWIGSLIFDKKEDNIQEDKEWAFQVYGRDHISEATNIAQALQQTYKIPIKVILKAEKPNPVRIRPN